SLKTGAGGTREAWHYLARIDHLIAGDPPWWLAGLMDDDTACVGPDHPQHAQARREPATGFLFHIDRLVIGRNDLHRQVGWTTEIADDRGIRFELVESLLADECHVRGEQRATLPVENKANLNDDTSKSMLLDVRAKQLPNGQCNV